MTQHISLPPVLARALVALLSALTRVVMRSAERSQSALIRACVTESAPSAPHLSPRPTSPPATERLKSASTGWVAADFTPGRTGCYSNFIFIPVSVWSRPVLMLLPRRAALAPSVRSMGSRHAPVPAKKARMRLSSATCAAWRRVSHVPFFFSFFSPSQLDISVFRKKVHLRFCFCHLNCVDWPWLISTVNPNTCSSTGSERLARFFNKKVTTLPAGSPCNDFKGYCDVFMKCRLVDADGPLARLKKAIFNPELYENIAEWIVVCILILVGWFVVMRCFCIDCAWFMLFFFQAHWWAVLLMGIALIMLMAGFIKICSVHTPSSNPKLPPPKPLPGESRDLQRQLIIPLLYIHLCILFGNLADKPCTHGFIYTDPFLLSSLCSTCYTAAQKHIFCFIVCRFNVLKVSDIMSIPQTKKIIIYFTLSRMQEKRDF